MKKPNVIFFFTDQQRWDSMGLHGNPLDLTPNLDRVARENLHLRHCFTPQPVCGPARACLQTGMYATSIRYPFNGCRLPDDVPTMAKCFNEAGYATGYIGKWHLAGRDNPRGPVPPERRGGYQYWLGADALETTTGPYSCTVYDTDQTPKFLPGYRVDALTNAAIDYVHEHKDSPFLLFLSLIEPHQQNRTDDYPAPVGYRERYQGRWTPPDLQALSGSSAKHLGGYWGMIRRIDEAYGRLQDALLSLGLDENTIVIFTSDHGCHFKTRTTEYKRTCHESSIRVPGVISGPGFKGMGQLSQFVSLIDLMPTVLDAAALPVPSNLDGKSILPLLKNRASQWPDSILIQITQDDAVGRAIRTGRWKYAVMSKPSHAIPENGQASSYEEQFLYDLKHDPYEIENLIASSGHTEVREHLRGVLLQRMQEAGEPVPQIIPAVALQTTGRNRIVFPEEILE